MRVAAGVCTSSSIEQAWVARLLHRLKQARRDGPLPHLLYYGYTSMTAPSRSPLAVLTTEQARRDGPLLRFLQSQEQVGLHPISMGACNVAMLQGYHLKPHVL